MKAKLLILPLAFLLFLPTDLMAANKKRRVEKVVRITSKVITRVPFTFDFTAEEVGDALQIVFIGGLPDSEVTVTDKDGTVVWEEHQTPVYEGKTIRIENAEDYPYLLKVDSPVVEVTGEIVLEEAD